MDHHLHVGVTSNSIIKSVINSVVIDDWQGMTSITPHNMIVLSIAVWIELGVQTYMYCICTPLSRNIGSYLEAANTL